MLFQLVLIGGGAAEIRRKGELPTNSSNFTHIRTASALLLSTTAIGLTAPAQADTTPECNTNDGSDGIADTADDNLECGADSSATGENSAAIGNDALVVGDRSLAVGNDARATGDSNTAMGQGSRAGDAASGTGG